MRKIILILVAMSVAQVSLPSNITNNINNGLARNNDELTIDKLINAINNTNFRFKNNAKDIPSSMYKKMLVDVIHNRALKQLEIEAWNICDYKKIDNYNIYIQNYSYISKEVFNNYCKELNALMIIDGIIKQSK